MKLRTTKVTMMLADHAECADGKLFINGGGWTATTGQIPFAVVISIEMPWSAAGTEHSFKLELLDDEGVTVEVPHADSGMQPLIINGGFQVSAAPGMPRGTPLATSMAINLSPPPPLAPRGRFEWRLEVDGETHEDWRLGFTTLPTAQSKAA